MIDEYSFMIAIALFFAVPFVAACWSLVIEWYIFDKAQKKAAQEEWDEWKAGASP